MNASPSKNILIVEDSLLNGQITADMLQAFGYETTIVRTGEEALEKISGSRRPDLVLMDIELGSGMNGIDTAKIINARYKIPIVFLTANASRKIMEQVRSVTAYGYVIKSTDPHALLSAVEMALARWQTENELQLYSCLVENALNEVYVFDSDTLKFITVNRIARENLGYTMEELCEMTPLDCTPEIDLQSLKTFLAPLAKGARKQVVFHTIQHRKDGSFYPMKVHLQLLEQGKKKAYLALAIDLTERRTLEQELGEKQEAFRVIANSVNDAIVMLNEQGVIVFWNWAAEQLFGYSQKEVLEQKIYQVLMCDDKLYQGYKQAFRQFQPTEEGSKIRKTIEHKAKRKDGREIYVEVSLSALKVKDSWHAIGVMRDISRHKEKEAQLYRLSFTDSLTDTYNRRFFTKKLKQEIERTRRTGKTFSIVMLDLDHFEDVNDRFGHAAGDQALRAVATAIKSRIRKTDTLARWGGEEFMILLPETAENSAVCLAKELCDMVSSLTIPGVGQVTASFGVTGYMPCDTVSTITMRTDKMMYEAKRAGRNCVRYKIG